MASLFQRRKRGPWIIEYRDHKGKKIRVSTYTTDTRDAEREQKRIEGEQLEIKRGLRSGRITRAQLEAADANKKPLSAHLDDYEAFCRFEQDPRWIPQKIKFLNGYFEHCRATRIADLSAVNLTKFLDSLSKSGLSAATVNKHRNAAVAFLNWCVQDQRLESNPLSFAKKLDENRDRRRVRRPLTDDELARLLRVAEEHGRRLWYQLAAQAGLRRGDLSRLKWSDVDLEQQAITIRDGKARRVDVIPIHPQLLDELKRARSELTTLPPGTVFKTSVAAKTQQKDFARAGLGYFEVVEDKDGNPLYRKYGGCRRLVTRYVAEDEDGRVVDLHAMRMTLATNLARAGVTPQAAQKILRHSDYRTTQKHYEALGLHDAASAMARVPGIQTGRDAAARTGTDGVPESGCQSKCQSSVHETPRTDARHCETDEQTRAARGRRDGPFVPKKAVLCDELQSTASKRANGLEPSTFSLEG